MDIVEHLKKIRFVGPFPQGLTVLLVPLASALDEAQAKDPEMTVNKLKELLKKNNIIVFGSMDDWAKLKGLK